MKINRLLSITTILLNRGSVTAKELAERFGVSTRTIYRDVDVLSSSGVPVFATRGANGGISLLENYSLGRTALTDKESEYVSFALEALKATRYPEIDRVLDKLGAIFKNQAADWIHIDFSPWGSDPNQYDKMTVVKNAVLSSKMIEFEYISASNAKSLRRLEPLRLIFKGRAWYLWGYNAEREDFRTFRISRMRSVKILDVGFDRNRERLPKTDDAPDADLRKPVRLELRFSERALFRLYDDYDDDMIRRNANGSFSLSVEFPEDEWVYGYILSFGDYVEVIGPPHVREIIREKISDMREKYG